MGKSASVGFPPFLDMLLSSPPRSNISMGANPYWPSLTPEGGGQNPCLPPQGSGRAMSFGIVMYHFSVTKSKNFDLKEKNSLFRIYFLIKSVSSFFKLSKNWKYSENFPKFIKTT